jgi:hypothetical protein
MNKAKTSFFSLTSFIILLSFIISSCRNTNNVVSAGIIQKRKYNKGYFVNIFPKRQKVTAVQTPQSETVITSSNQTVTGTDKNDDDLLAATDDVKQTVNNPSKPILPDEKIIQQKQSNRIIGKIIGKIERKLITPFPKDVTDDNPKVNGFALAGFICGVSAPLLLGLLTLVNVVVTFPIFAISAVIAIPCAIIFSAIGLHQIKLYPYNYKGKIFAIIGIVIGLAGIIIVFFLVFLVKGLFLFLFG